MNYYNEIKNNLINNEINKRVKEYSINKSDLSTYYNVGKLLYDAGKHYGEGIINKYSAKLVNEVDKKYNPTNLKRMRQFYLIIEKGALFGHQLSWSHYKELIPLKNIDKINYYINLCEKNPISRDKLREKIKSKEYERLSDEVKKKLKDNKKVKMIELIPDPILIKSNGLDKDNIKEKVLKKLILEDIDRFLKQLGDGFCYISNEYPIKLDRFYYMDLLLFNIKYNCYVVIEIKVNELKKEDVGQISFYMNYIDKNIKGINQDKTIGIILVKKDNKLVLEYSTDKRIYSRTYELI